MRFRLQLVALAGLLLAVLFVMCWTRSGRVLLGLDRKPPIRIGLLHSQTGHLAISERAIIDGEVLALEELNARGGIDGRRLEWLIADGESDPAMFAERAEELILRDKIDVIIGCWTSDCRQAVRPVVEKHNKLLIYPINYEGLEESENIFYTGQIPSQQIMPAVAWAMEKFEAKKFLLVASEDLWAHAIEAIVQDQLKALGAEMVGTVYIPQDTTDVTAAIAEIKAKQPDVVLNGLFGQTNGSLFRELRLAGETADKRPVISLALSEEELRSFAPADLTGHYLAAGYFQVVDTQENDAFVERFQARFGTDRVTSDSIATAYTSVLLLAEAAYWGNSIEPGQLQRTMGHLSLRSPVGILSMDNDTQHAYRTFLLARIGAQGKLEIVSSSHKPIRPVPFPISRSRTEWLELVRHLLAR